ncbi:warthog protein 6 [Selaginella moellendorffii]|uniref:warthog protein 6 n=1 Tax=Selaginella moellendorffii TaxID=88036 RepID=UPI000D1CF6FD|nr:warthog protein 6 [Selaginella moellendorffii]|eukprot:XP_024537580.1 warthog protein 6 [Selaginella moellendorffii]
MASLAAVFAVVSLLGLFSTVFATNIVSCTTTADCTTAGLTGFTCNNGICQNPGCFPGDAMVHMYSGEMKTMKELKIGDKVAVGKNSFSDIYAFGHKDLDVVSEFVQVKTEANTLELTAGHFVPVNTKGEIIYKRAADLKVGDSLSTISGASPITEISKVDKLGLYNPLTLSGNILVNNVVASVHSEWFLDSLFDALGASEYLPYAYQSLLAPVRALYNIAGSKLYSAGYSMLDSCVNVADSGTKYGGPIAITIGIGALAFAARSI